MLDRLKKPLLLLALSAFVATPLMGVPQVASAGQEKSSSKKSAAKTAGKSKKSHLRAGKTKKSHLRTGKTKKQYLRSGKTRKQYLRVQQPDTPLRAMNLQSAEALVGGDLALRSAAALVVDQKSGTSLYAKNVDVPTPIASITKLMTAMVTLDAGLDLDEEITISNEDLDRLKGTGSRLSLGTRLTRGELLHLALIASENRAAAALTRAYPGGRDAFVAAMNAKARQIGMRHASFVDGTGLNSRNQATAADLVKMVDAAYRYPIIREISSTGSYDVSVPGRKVVRVKEKGKVRRVTRDVQKHIAFHNTNALTRSKDWDIGVSKTGYINEAGHCLVMQAQIAEQKVIIVLLDSWGKFSRIGDAQRIKQWLERDSQVASRAHRDSA